MSAEVPTAATCNSLQARSGKSEYPLSPVAAQFFRVAAPFLVTLVVILLCFGGYPPFLWLAHGNGNPLISTDAAEPRGHGRAGQFGSSPLSAFLHKSNPILTLMSEIWRATPSSPAGTPWFPAKRAGGPAPLPAWAAKVVW